MVLDRQGGPNWFKNWCVAPVIVDAENDEVYFTPLYYVMAHFSKFMRPGAVKIGCEVNNKQLKVTAVQNIDKSIALVIFNPTATKHSLELQINNQNTIISIDAQALQTVIIKK
jgi:glucosylceramidase